MPRKPNPELVGRTDCTGCGTRIPVYLNARGYLYTKCTECGVDQRNGPTIQTHLYYTTEWTGEPPARPRGVPDQAPAPHRAEEPESEPEPAPVPTGPEPENDPKPTPTSRAGARLFGPGLALGLLVGPLLKLGRYL